MAQQTNQIDVGKSGVAYLDDTGAFTPPTGKVIVAVNVVAANTSFTTLTPANAVGTYYPGTATTATAVGNGVNAEAIVDSDNFPAGQWIYGRFSACTLADGAVFLYFGEE